MRFITEPSKSLDQPIQFASKLKEKKKKIEIKFKNLSRREPAMCKQL